MGESVPLRCAIYCRISQDRESELRGVTRQEQDCRELAAQRGWEVVGVYVDNDLSASTRSKKSRPEFDAMVAAVRAGAIDVLDDWLDDDPDRLMVRRAILNRYVSRIIVKPIGKGASSRWGGPPPDSVVIVPRQAGRSDRTGDRWC
ncbi:recombinase family protein [Micromonospora sp. NPDC049282]|uniref:recombinase family protein n=1 Tax=Micromonospora sp. NPDC049282 TaxID=3364269 RepID=UPI0037165C9F